MKDSEIKTVVDDLWKRFRKWEKRYSRRLLVASHKKATEVGFLNQKTVEFVGFVAGYMMAKREIENKKRTERV